MSYPLHVSMVNKELRPFDFGSLIRTTDVLDRPPEILNATLKGESLVFKIAHNISGADMISRKYGVNEFVHVCA